MRVPGFMTICALCASCGGAPAVQAANDSLANSEHGGGHVLHDLRDGNGERRACGEGARRSPRDRTAGHYTFTGGDGSFRLMVPKGAVALRTGKWGFKTQISISSSTAI
jgi:hypothetical protein